MNQILQKLSETRIKYIPTVVLRRDFFPPQWKIAQIIMIQKPDKSVKLAESYKLISLLPALSKLF
jgi:hypothetical protein